MGKSIATRYFLSVGGTDFSDHVKSLSVQMNRDPVDVTAMGDTSHTSAVGLRDDQIDVEFYQDFAASVHAAMMTAFTAGDSGATIVCKPNSSATVSASNPTFTMVGIPFTYSPLDASVGDASMTKITFKPAAGGYIAVATA